MNRIGRYEIVRELGRGAMGVVYHAIDPAIGRSVAIKTIRLGEVTNPTERSRLRERLLREARSAGILSHPGIVTIYDVVEEGDLAYIAMEYVNGPTLDQVMTERPIPPEQMFAILGQTAVALDYAHSKGTVHRDIKPANIMIAEDGSAKITDFGIAKVVTSEQFTMTGTIVGTPHYMAPEQVQGHPVDGRADQFSFAVIAYEILTGEKPFTGEHLTTVVYKIVAEEPPPPRRVNPTLGPAIEAVLKRALAKKPENRYPSCQEFVTALEEACAASKGWKTLARGGVLNLPTVADQPRTMLPPPHRRPVDDSGTRERKRLGVLPVMFAILVAAALVGLIAWQATPWLARSKQATPPAPVDSRETPLPAPTPAVGETAAAKPPEALPERPKALGPASPPKPEEKEPGSPLSEPRPASPESKPAPVTRSPQVSSIVVPTSPAGATAMLDGRADSACITPCTLQASPGRHTLTVSRPGHQSEYRELVVTNNSQEVPLITLRSAGGTLMLSTTPAGAAITIDGRERPEKTPAQISLPPGHYTVTVEKDGKKSSEQVEIRNGINLLKIPLGQSP